MPMLVEKKQLFNKKHRYCPSSKSNSLTEKVPRDLLDIPDELSVKPRILSRGARKRAWQPKRKPYVGVVEDDAIE